MGSVLPSFHSFNMLTASAGYGMFAILVPVCSAPIIGALTWSQLKAKRLGVIHSLNPNASVTVRSSTASGSIGARLKSWASEVDAIGLLLLGAGWTCVGTACLLSTAWTDIACSCSFP